MQPLRNLYTLPDVVVSALADFYRAEIPRIKQRADERARKSGINMDIL